MKINLILTARFGNVLFEVQAAHHIRKYYSNDVKLYALVNDESENPYAYKQSDFNEIQQGLVKFGYTDKIEQIKTFNQFNKNSFINLSNCPFDYISIESLKSYALNFHTDELCLIGYFQNKKYIEDIQPVISVDKYPVVGIHVRCGDYLNLNHIFPNLQTTEYFIKSLNYIGKIIEIISHDEFKIKVFSDEPDKINLKLFSGYDIYVVKNNSWIDDFYEFAKCPFKIISNSTFSYQASIISDSRLICAPSCWNNVFLHSPYEVYAKLYRNDFKMIQ